MEQKKEKNSISLYEKLSNIQNEMNVKKSQFNKFGNYRYRSAEDILGEAKKVCNKHRTTLIVTDAIENIEDRFYVKSSAWLYDWDSTQELHTEAYAREELSKKGMDSSQVTGSCSSYARKYALNGLFNLDDIKDADTDEQHLQTNAPQKQKSGSKLDELRIRCYKAQNELQKLAIDTRDAKFADKLLFAFSVRSQDIQNMSEEDLQKLLCAYTQIYKEEAKK